MKSFVQSIFKENLALKVAALILAILVELYLYSPDRWQEMTHSVRVVFRNLPANTMIVWPIQGEQGFSAVVHLRGPGAMLEQLNPEELQFKVDLPSGKGMQFQVALRPESLGLPRGLDVISIDPPTMELKLDEVVDKELPVVAKPIGEPPKGYELEFLRPFPRSVSVKGPKGELESITEIEAKKVDISGVKGVQRFETALLPLGRFIQPKVNVVEVEAKVIPVSYERELPRVGVEVIAPDGFAATVEPSAVRVAIAGPEDQLNALELKRLRVLVDAKELSVGSHDVELTVEVPQQFHVLRVIPPTVKVNLRSEK